MLQRADTRPMCTNKFPVNSYSAYLITWSVNPKGEHSGDRRGETRGVTDPRRHAEFHVPEKSTVLSAFTYYLLLVHTMVGQPLISSEFAIIVSRVSMSTVGSQQDGRFELQRD